ncbi:MAG: sigma 54-interacting transcriptional regulator [Planctomycetota bacterium]|nr:MAG: sigma 54-interacting transcriptional regulator [Planctomycetota bacterium]
MSIKEHGLPGKTLSALVEASGTINASLELPKTLQAIAQTAATVMDAEAASVLLLDCLRNKLVFRAATGVQGDRLIGVEFDAHLGIAGRVVRSGKPAVVIDVHKDKDFFSGIDDQYHFTTRGLVAAPLVKKDEIIGAVEVLNKNGQDNFTRGDLELLQVFANIAACAVDNAQVHEKLKQENRGLRAGQDFSGQIIGHSQALIQALDLCARVAASNATVLVLGETGTGKELIARHIHANSSRNSKPFIALNCAALPETLLESELFGHEKGAFTGAVSQKIGRFELANGGTIFLDEIGDISHSTQIKLLRVLQEKDFVRVGGTKTVTCDVRVIAATNRDIQKAVEKSDIREDLYYRLNVFPIQMPPLRQRREDIPMLVEHFVKVSATQLNVPPPQVTEEAMAMLTTYKWPGNIRELQNILERAVLLSDGRTIGANELPKEITGKTVIQPLDKNDSGLWGYEKALIVKALRENGWNQTRAAKVLNISRDNLRYRIKKYDIKKPD